MWTEYYRHVMVGVKTSLRDTDAAASDVADAADTTDAGDAAVAPHPASSSSSWMLQQQVKEALVFHLAIEILC